MSALLLLGGLDPYMIKVMMIILSTHVKYCILGVHTEASMMASVL